MKIGVAFSGSGAGAASAYAFADELQKCAIPIEMLSVTSLPAISTLLWSHGLQAKEIDQRMALFFSAPSPAYALEAITREGVFASDSCCDLAVNSVDIATGVTVIHSDRLKSDAWNLKVVPLAGNEARAALSTVSPYCGCEPLLFDGMRLCDFGARYGCPYFPLKMAGIERLLSVSFAGGETPAQIAADSLSALTGRNANLHFTVKLDGGEDAQARIRAFVQARISEIYDKLLF